jgi:hypothetical protein
MPEAPQIVPPENVERTKKWLMLRFREMLRGAKLTAQITRWLSGELGDSYNFINEVSLDPKAKTFIESPKNTDLLNEEKL